MTTLIPFTKMHGIGNDYVYVDGFAHEVADPAGLSRRIADRHRGVGSDGLILILPAEQSVDADVRMRMYNADGSESEMCGNGIRCVCKYAHDHDLSRARPMRVQTGAGVLVLDYTLDDTGLVDSVTVDMGAPALEATDIPVVTATPRDRVVDVPWGDLLQADLPGRDIDPLITCVSMGNPHAIVFGREIAGVPLETIGPAVENDPAFPNRVNLHLVEVHSRGEVTMRTWERGSGLTQACGTGAAAVCVAGALTGRTERELLAHLPGGDLSLEWDPDGGHVLMSGPAVEVFSGTWSETPAGSEGRAHGHVAHR